MNLLTNRRRWLASLAAALLLAACGTTPSVAPETRATLAPTGKLRVGVYLGSPTSLVRTPAGEARGVAVEMGQALARELGVPVEQVEFPRLASVLDALKAGQVDFTVTNATPARAVDMNFTEPLVMLELGYLALPSSRVQSIADVDQPGVRIGVSQGSTSQGTLAKRYQQANVVPAPSLQAAAEMLKAGQLDAFATNKGILFEMTDGLPGARVLPGHWGLEQLAIAIPKGREAAMPAVQQFAARMRAEGAVQRAADRAGLRGTAAAQAKAQTTTEVLWLAQAAFKITSPGGKVIVVDPWLRTNPKTPAEYKKLEAFGRIDALLVTHGHFDHAADAPALALMYDTPIRAQGGLNQSLDTLGVLPSKLLPRMDKGGTVEAAPGIRITAVRAEHSSVYVWQNPATGKNETHVGGEPIGWIIELENGFRIYHAGDTAVFGDMRYIGERYKPDLALVPIGGNFTMDPADAAYAVKELIRPKAVIPIHFGVNPLAKGTAKEFVDAMGASAVRVIVAEPGVPLNF